MTNNVNSDPPHCGGIPPPDSPQVNTIQPLPNYLFLGKLSIVESVESARDAWLCLTHRCDHCRGPHHHTWGLEADLSAPVHPTHRGAHCWRPNSPYEAPVGYWIFPRACSENERVLLRFRELLRLRSLATSEGQGRRRLVELAESVMHRGEWSVDE